MLPRSAYRQDWIGLEWIPCSCAVMHNGSRRVDTICVCANWVPYCGPRAEWASACCRLGVTMCVALLQTSSAPYSHHVARLCSFVVFLFACRGWVSAGQLF